MRSYATENIRDIVLVSQSRSGKTTLGEAMLFNAKATTRLGKVLEGNSVLDFEPEEQKRQSSIFSAIFSYKWQTCGINMVDTPGDTNFSSESILGLKSAENAIFVISAIGGVKPHTENLWQMAGEEGLTRSAFINKMDRENANFEKILGDIQEQFGIRPLPLTIPIGAEAEFRGVIDVMNKRAFIFKNDGSGLFEEASIPAELSDDAETAFMQMVEDLAEVDDDLMEKYLDGGDLTPAEMDAALKRGLREGKFLPVFAGSALCNMGIQPLMDYINNTLVNPGEKTTLNLTDKDGHTKELPVADDAAFCGYVFKTMSDPYTGTLSIIRCLSGSLKPDSSLYNQGEKERIGSILTIEGKNQKPLDLIGPGDIFAVAKLKNTKTGDTLLAEDINFGLPAPHFPDPIMDMAVSPKTKADVDKILPAIKKLMDEDPVLRGHRDEETGEFILSGLGQLHIEIAVDRLKRRYGVEVDIKTPKVPYKETITAKADVQGKHKKQSGGHGQYGDCKVVVEPLNGGQHFEFVDKIVGGSIPRTYIPAVEKGIVESMNSGPLTGSPMTGIKVTLYDGSYHDVDSSEMAFKIAGSLAFKKAMEACKPILLEPIMNLTVTVPEDSMGDVMGDLNSRRGKIEGMNARGKYQELKAQVPLAEILTYASELTSITSGRGTFNMSFSHMEPVPYNIQDKIVAEAQAARDVK